MTLVYYCVTCKKFTNSKNVQTRKTKNNRLLLIGICVNCGKKKSTFIKKKIGKGLVNDLLNSGKLPEMHLPGHSFTGPGTKLKKRLLRQDKPVNKLDEKAQFHDMAYSIFKDKNQRHVFDKKMQNEAAEIARDPTSTMKEKIEAGLVSGIMLGKRKLGLGNKQLK